MRRRSQVSQAGFCLVPIVLFVPVKGVDLRHFRIGQLEAVQFGVLLDMVGIAGAGVIVTWGKKDSNSSTYQLDRPRERIFPSSTNFSMA